MTDTLNTQPESVAMATESADALPEDMIIVS